MRAPRSRHESWHAPAFTAARYCSFTEQAPSRGVMCESSPALRCVQEPADAWRRAGGVIVTQRARSDGAARLAELSRTRAPPWWQEEMLEGLMLARSSPTAPRHLPATSETTRRCVTTAGDLLGSTRWHGRGDSPVPILLPMRLRRW